jgi:hypothetical protein
MKLLGNLDNSSEVTTSYEESLCCGWNEKQNDQENSPCGHGCWVGRRFLSWLNRGGFPNQVSELVS